MSHSMLAAAIAAIRPDATYVLRGETLDGLEWLDEQSSAPTEGDVAYGLSVVAWDAVRRERDRLLAASDWTQVADAPVDAAAWAVYRQALRDVPQDYSTPDEVVWPTQPA